MANSIRGIHVSPGVYSKETDITYAVKSLGITTLGVVGETQKGPAFQPMAISNWREFVDTFGGTNPEKFKGSQYPKYELPYIAKSYLTQSNQLEVVRVLGLSGYNAGPAWVVTANVESNSKKRVVAVLRPRGQYYKYRKFDASTGSCDCPNESYDSLVYDVGEVQVTSDRCKMPVMYNPSAVTLTNYTPLYSMGNECDGHTFSGDSDDSSFDVSGTNLGRFKIQGIRGVHSLGESYSACSGSSSSGDCFQYAVSLNSADKDYIINVLGTDPSNGDAPLYVESLYDVSLEESINSDESNVHINKINKDLTFYQVFYSADYNGLEPVTGILTMQENNLSRKNIGQRYLADLHAATPNEYKGDTTIMSHIYDYTTNLPEKWSDLSAHTITSGDDEVFSAASAETKTGFAVAPVIAGFIYTVTQYTDGNGKRHFYYRTYSRSSIKSYIESKSGSTTADKTANKLDTTPLYDNLVKAGVWTEFADFASVKYNAEIKNSGKTASTTARFAAKAPATNETGGSGQETAPKPGDETHTVTDGEKFPGALIDNTRDAYGDKQYRQVCVKNLADGLYYRLNSDGTDIVYVDCDLNNYKSAYRYASTPWIVSNLMGDYEHIELKRLFRFHTISDGESSNNEIKISIENIRPDDGVFDVVIRDISDTDEYPVVLEKFMKCNLVAGSKNYIAYKIGSYDGSYEAKSKYVTVECKEGDQVANAIPAGFLGYPCVKFDGHPIVDNAASNIENPLLTYNRDYDVDVKNRKQYFGLSTRVGVDLDMFTYKGEAAYIDKPEMLTNGFHLDSRLNTGDTYTPTITVDGEVGYKFDAVSQNNRTTTLVDTPIIGSEEAMAGTIYEYQNLRKFTLYFYGGFDGWDKFRDQRSNTDDFKLSKYLGSYDRNSGEGYSFNRIDNPETLGLNQNGITSDWYAYLSAIRQFANPEAVDINVFATPGIDYVNNTSLVEEAIEMIEEERADSIYVVTTPDKPSGAGDFVDEMYTPEDVVYNLEDTEINSNYTCTYYPWVKYLDEDNNQYIYLPATKDAVRDMAQTDNTAYPWFAPAGIERGDVDCVKAHFITKLADEDTLYEGRINPIKTFAADGVHIWGQKNLQVAESQLNRIAVRRLLLRMRKLIAIACRNLIFEPNDSTTKNSFLSIVTPIMDNIKSNRGISEYQIEVDDTEEARERRELPGRIFFKPYNALEYVLLDFVVTPEGMSFSDI